MGNKRNAKSKRIPSMTKARTYIPNKERRIPFLLSERRGGIKGHKSTQMFFSRYKAANLLRERSGEISKNGRFNLMEIACKASESFLETIS